MPAARRLTCGRISVPPYAQSSTSDGAEADFFLVPFLSKCYYNYEARYALPPMDAALRQVVSYLRGMPW